MKKFFTFLAMSAVVLGMASCGDGTNNGNEPEITNPEQGTEPEVTSVPEGAISGKFTVAKNKQVWFSMGNLQYNDMEDKQKKWRFAENQWEYVGDATNGTVYEGYSKCDNALVRNGYNGWIDMFLWGTSDPNMIGTGESTDVYRPYFEWGAHPISNGGNKYHMWRTLEDAEWSYLLLLRDRATDLFGLGMVNNVKGLILLPDDWETPDGLTFNPSAKIPVNMQIQLGCLVRENDRFTNSKEMNFAHNVYNSAKWDTMEKNGAVFLPAAGYRDGTNVKEAGTEGHYWTSTARWPDGLVVGQEIMFNARYFYFENTQFGWCGLSIRLVQDVK